MAKKATVPSRLFAGVKSVIGFIVFYWQVTPTVLLAMSAAIWAYAHNVGLVEASLWVIWILSGSLLLTCCFLWLGDRRRPRSIVPAHDTSYGLSYSGVGFGYNPNADTDALQAFVVFQNVSTGPLKFHVQRIDVVLGKRTIPEAPWANRGGTMPRAASRNFRYHAFPKSEIDHLVGKPSQGVIEFWVNYGPAEGAFERRLHMKVGLTFVIRATDVAQADVILSEKDCELELADEAE
jgi:hypothetical protein